jgi:hypothetical protein
VPFSNGPLHVQAAEGAVFAGQLAVDEHRASGVLAADAEVVGGNQAGDDGLDWRRLRRR